MGRATPLAALQLDVCYSEFHRSLSLSRYSRDEQIAIYANWSEAERRANCSRPTRFPHASRFSLADPACGVESASANVHSVLNQLVEAVDGGCTETGIINRFLAFVVFRIQKEIGDRPCQSKDS